MNISAQSEDYFRYFTTLYRFHNLNLQSPFQVFNQCALQAKTAHELTNAVADFMDCSIVIPPTEIQNEAMLTSIINFQKKLLQDRNQATNPLARRDSKARRGAWRTSLRFQDAMQHT